MPQINRIRVNNVKYNFGTQYYDDFLMRFNCKNTIYDLANGGGKSLLMLLLMQNMIPNCTLDDKQPIEKLFRQGSGNTCIHSLVEWKLDACYQQDGFKYMTTGFCARKGKGTDDEEEGDTAAAASSASVEYFNYCIFYREYGDNDIKNLPLVKDGERITYNGLKAYLRELEKGEFKYTVKIFDRKGDYQSFISNYGIYESAWEIVRGINKTEGHVRTYFESNYRTSRKVVEDLLIEEIIQKSFNNRLSVDNDEGKMAKTLLDIKDKLVELSKKHSQIGAFDSQIAAIDGFKEYCATYDEFYTRKEQVEKQLYDMLLAAMLACREKEKELAKKNQLLDKINSEIDREKEAVAVAEVILEKNSQAAVEELVEETRKIRNHKNDEIRALEDRLVMLEAANDYNDYEAYERSYNELSVALEARLREDEDIIEELKQISRRYKDLYDKENANLNEKKSLADNRIKKVKAKLDEAKELLRNADKENAAFSGFKEHIESVIRQDEIELKELLANAQCLVAENAEDELMNLKAQQTVVLEKLNDVNSEYDRSKEELIAQKESINASEALISILTREASLLKEKENFTIDNKERIESIRSIYNAPNDSALSEIILDTYNHMNREYEEINREILNLEAFIENAENGFYVCNDSVRNRLKEYLVSQYGEDVVEGHEWFRGLSAGEKRDVLKRTPFIEYGFIIKNDFERIKTDETLLNFGRSGVVYPVISEQVLIDTKLEINKDLIVFALKDLSFLRDEVRLETEIKLAKEELEGLNNSATKLADRKALVWDDYRFVLEYLAAYKNVNLSKTIGELEEKIDNENNNVRLATEASDKLANEINNYEQVINDLKAEAENISQRCEALECVVKKHVSITDNYRELNSITENILNSSKRVSECEELVEKTSKEYDTAVEFDMEIEDRIKQAGMMWESEYAGYYDESTILTISDEVYQFEKEELESRFLGLKAALTDKNNDFADKQAFMAHLKVSMNKCCENIEYKGKSFEEIKSLIKSGELSPTDTRKLKAFKEELADARKDSDKFVEELEAQEALLNRLEGSIAHGINQIEERYGEFREFECDNPEIFMEQHKELIKKLEDSIKQQNNSKNVITDALKELMVCVRDLERIVSDAGMSVPVEFKEDEARAVKADLNNYEAVSKEYNSINKLEFKKVDEFAKNKQKLIDLLTGFNASELAQEVKLSVNMPENAYKSQELVKSLSETITFIELERDRISKGIEDMERIKDNFENRCIQTCCNIKTELDRLPQLSNINLDGEQISIISLQIPYIREEMYKERMSDYIDETVVMAESFKDVDERLKYIRNRLTWKRLFSVIVTDMNSIKINLYKRERIKEQSRYLRYEEAVGSTGQSQGIYIQFLISIINYISNMNSKNSDGGIEGKTIFIDNPFGAAKDIYIWEPIFKLLSTNHVQLVVPARGATPAITGRFEVNYILGQKLADKRQQTVVVDYYSNTGDSELEYTRMDYEQATFDFL